MLLDGLGAVRNFVRNLHGGPDLLRSRQVSFMWSVGTLCRSHSWWYSPQARLTEKEASPAPHRMRNAIEGAGLPPPTGTRRQNHAGPPTHYISPTWPSCQHPLPSHERCGLVSRRAGYRSWLWLLLGRR